MITNLPPTTDHDAALLPEFRLESYFAKYEFTARYNLAASDAETHALSELLAMADDADRARWDSLRLGYTPTAGSPPLREAIAETYETLAASDVLTFVGAEEGIYCAMHAILSPGDHAVVLVPNYQSAEEIPRAICEVSGVPLREEASWTLDLDQLRAALRPNTRLIAINFPNNPTGKMIDAETLATVVEMAAERDIYLFSDEVYRGLERDEIAPLPPAADLYHRGLSLGVVSKALGLAGLRLGWIACRDPEVLSRMERVKHYLSICNAGPSEVLATIAVKARARILARNRVLTTGNLARLTEFCERHAHLIQWYRPDGGCIAFPRFLGTEGADAFCRAAVEDASVILLPGHLFRSSLLPVSPNRFRIGFGRADFAEGLGALEHHLAGRPVRSASTATAAR